MKSRPILFAEPMVRALLDGKKTVTRRMAKDYGKCRYGEIGDHLWIKESWRSIGAYPDNGTIGISYGAGGSRYVDRDDWGKYFNMDEKWRSSMFMPKWASRITLEISHIRFERLQDITEDEAIREGATWHNLGRYCGHFDAGSDVGDCKKLDYHPQRNGWTMEPPQVEDALCFTSARMAFANYINKLNGPETWDNNPFVWAISFKNLTGGNL